MEGITMDKDVNFTVENDRFNFRVAYLMFCENKVLLATFDDFDFYNLPGGRAKIGESTVDALKRELKEELGYELAVKPELKIVSEDFFDWKDKNVHELLFVFKINLPSEYIKKFENFKILDSKNETVNWFKKDQLKNIKCIKKFINDVFDMPDGLVHIVNDELYNK